MFSIRCSHFFAGCVLLGLVMSISAQEAGEGTYQPFFITKEGQQSDGKPLVAQKDYLRIEAVTWYVNKQGGILTNRMVSGTVDVQLGNENFQTILEPYELKDGNRVAPMFNRTALYNRVYTGGDIRMRVFIMGFKSDTKLGGLLKDLASIAVDLGVSRVGAASAFSVGAPIGGATSKVAESVKTYLNQAESQKGIFAANGGFDFTFPNPHIGQETYFLAFKGDQLDKTKLKVVSNGAIVDVSYDNSPLAKGAWVLFRVSRESAFGDRRPWMAPRDSWKADIESLMSDWQSGIKTKDDALKELTPSLDGNNVADRMRSVREQIKQDIALTVDEQTRARAEVNSLFALARGAAVTNNFATYFQGKQRLDVALTTGVAPSDSLVVNAFETEMVLVQKERSISPGSILLERNRSTLWKDIQKANTVITQP